jgi:hypothetical protein
MSESAKGWIGVDLDGTVAEYHGWRGIENIGKPIPKMVNRIQKWISEGKIVKIFTARASGENKDLAILFIKIWCKENIGSDLEVVCEKDYQMVELWDDRAIGVEHNTGEIMSGKSKD